jgi:hypothetical protein
MRQSDIAGPRAGHNSRAIVGDIHSESNSQDPMK